VDEGVEAPRRGSASTALWSSECKDCRAERRVMDVAPKRRGRPGSEGTTSFDYSAVWASRTLERGQSRSDRCERHRRIHAMAVRAIAVPYVDLEVIGEVADAGNPSGPLGGLGPLPVLHTRTERDVDLAPFEFGMSDADVLAIIAGLAEKRVAVIEAGTGTGKSTFMPFRLMNPPPGARFRPVDLGPIVVTEPRRAAATGVSRYVGEELCFGCDSRKCERHIGPGFPVGYQVSGEKRWDSACELIYVTDGTMINWVRDGQLARIGTVIIDEAHERSENIDIILAQLREQLDQYEHLRVVITSATLDRDFFVSYFGGPERVFHHSIPAAKSFGYGTPLFVGLDLDQHIVENGTAISPDIRFPGWASEGPRAGDVAPEDLRATTHNLKRLRCVDEIAVVDWRRDMPAAVVKQVVAIAAGTAWGDILAFLPTNRMIQSVVEQIEDALADKKLAFDVYPLLSTTAPETARKAIAARSRGDKRKIVVSSNLAETSLTVKGVRYVVDSGLICQAEWDSDLASGSFPTKPHSQSGLRQRWGRVGRDAPGWVFPLYTVEQFLQLGKNTAPESAQVNLETFYMKLIASGIDPDQAALPGSFVDESVTLDKAGQEYVDVFKRESRRARRALLLTGAIDADGHLTDFGRELDRFSGDGASAMAMMLADQLACVHEVALALEVLGGGRLTGDKGDRILWVDPDWPIIWRVRAAQAHRGLAAGCRDDLDVLLRVASLWQASPDRRQWADQWWINEPALVAALEASTRRLEALSAAMKKQAARPVSMRLSGRARAVLSRALVSSRFRHTGERSYRAENDAEPEQVMLTPGQFAEPMERILALHRFRRGGQLGDAPRPAEISHIIEMLDWAEMSGQRSGDVGFDMILAAERHLPGLEAETPDRLLALIEALPIGALVELELVDRGGYVVSAKLLEPPLQRPSQSRRRSRRERDEDKGACFDRDWDPNRHRAAETPEEEEARRLVDVTALEANDLPDADGGRAPLPAQPGRALPPLIARPYLLGGAFSGTVRGRIAGYSETGGREVTLLIDERADGDDRETVDEQPIPWSQVDVIVAGVVPDYGGGFLQLNRADRRGSYYLDARGAGLDLYDLGFGARLVPGAALQAKILDRGEEGGPTVTLLPAARAQLASAPVEIRTVRSQPSRLYRATVIEPVGNGDRALVEIDYRDAETGLSHRFEVHRDKLEWAKLADAPAAAKLFVALEPSRGDRRKALRGGSDKVRDYVRGEPTLEVRDGRISPKIGDLTQDAVAGLIRAGAQDAGWASQVWDFYNDSLHMTVAAVFGINPVIMVPPRMLPLFGRRKADFEAALGVRLFLKREDCALEISSEEEGQARRALDELKRLAGAPRLSARLPAGLGGWLFGNGQANLKRLEARAEIHYIWVEDNIATVSATSEREAEAALREIVKPAMGVLVVPPNKNGVLIGKARERLNRLEAASGCSADNPDRSETWIVRGSSAAQVEAFIRLAESEVFGSAGRVTDAGRVSFLAEPETPARGDAVGAWRANNPAFFAEFPHATLVELASLTRPGPSAKRTGGLTAAALETGAGVNLDSEAARRLHLTAAKPGHVENQSKAGMLHPLGEEQLRDVRSAQKNSVDHEGQAERGWSPLACETCGSGELLILSPRQLATSQVYVVALPWYRDNGEVRLALERGDGELELPSVRKGEDESVEVCIAQLSEALGIAFAAVIPLLNMTYMIEKAGEPALRIVVRTNLVQCLQRPVPDPETCDLQWFGLDEVATAPVRDIYAAPLVAAIRHLRTERPLN
jgi:HrpA-like RNA helicase